MFVEDVSYDLTFLRLTELLITAGGENVAPTLIEDAIKRELSVVSNAMVIGDRKKFLSCLLTLKVTFLVFNVFEMIILITPGYVAADEHNLNDELIMLCKNSCPSFVDNCR